MRGPRWILEAVRPRGKVRHSNSNIKLREERREKREERREEREERREKRGKGKRRKREGEGEGREGKSVRAMID